MAPKRKGKKGTLNYALDVYDWGQMTTILSLRGDMCIKQGLEVMTLVRRTREVFGDNISPLQGAITLGSYDICKILVEEGASFKSASHIQQPLTLALQKADYDIANLLIDAGADVNTAYEHTFPMAFALEHKNCTVQMVKKIIAAGFPKNGICHRHSHRTTLHLAVNMNHINIVKYLIGLSIDLDVKCKRGLTPLHYAVQKNLAPMVKLLAKHGANLNCECTDEYTPLIYAIALGTVDMVKLLISLGADIHYVNGSKKCSMMPLHFASHFCRFKIVQLLLEVGADVNKVVPSSREIALHAAVRAQSQTVQQKIALDCIVELLINRGSHLEARNKNGFTPLQIAIKTQSFSVAKILVVNGAELNSSISENDERCYTTFHLAAKSLDKELIKLCLDYGGDYNLKDKEGMFPCHMALLTSMMNIFTQGYSKSHYTDDLDIFKLFWKHGFPCDLTSNINWLDNEITSFHNNKFGVLVQKQKMLLTGLKTRQPKMVQEAIAQGAEVRCCSTEIMFPLDLMAVNGDDSIMKQFLSRGFVVNSVNLAGETSLHVAAKSGSFNCCKLLLEYGANYNYSSQKCPETPLKMAKDNGHSDVVTLLTKVGKYFKSLRKGCFRKPKPGMKIFWAVMNCCDRDGRTLLATAVELGMKDAADCLIKLRLQPTASK